MKSMISSHCRRHCLSLTLQLPILFESCRRFIDTSLGCFAWFTATMDRGRQASWYSDDGETSFHVGDGCTCVV